MAAFYAELRLTLSRLLTSRKFITVIVGMIVGVAARHNIVLAPEDVNTVIALFGVLLAAQGAADIGKGAAYITAANPPPPTQTQTVSVDAAGDANVDTKGPQ